MDVAIIKQEAIRCRVDRFPSLHSLSGSSIVAQGTQIDTVQRTEANNDRGLAIHRPALASAKVVATNAIASGDHCLRQHFQESKRLRSRQKMIARRIRCCDSRQPFSVTLRAANC